MEKDEITLKDRLLTLLFVLSIIFISVACLIYTESKINYISVPVEVELCDKSIVERNYIFFPIPDAYMVKIKTPNYEIITKEDEYLYYEYDIGDKVKMYEIKEYFKDKYLSSTYSFKPEN